MTTPINPNPPITTPPDSQDPTAIDPSVAKAVSKGAASQTNAIQRPVDRHLSTSAEPWLEPPSGDTRTPTAAGTRQALAQIEQCGVDFAAIEDLLIKNNLTAFKESESASDSLMDQQIQALKAAANKMQSQAKTQETEAIVSAVVGLVVTLTTAVVGLSAANAGLADGVSKGIELLDEDTSELTSELSDTQTQDSEPSDNTGGDTSNTLDFELDEVQTEINDDVTEQRVQDSQDNNQESPTEKLEEEKEKLEEGREKLQQQDQDKERLMKEGYQQKFRWERFAAIAGIGQGISMAVQTATNAGFQSATSNEQQEQMQDQKRATLDGDLYSKAVNYSNESLQGVQQALSEIQSAVSGQDAAIRKIFS